MKEGYKFTQALSKNNINSCNGETENFYAQKTVKGILKIALAMFLHPTENFNKILGTPSKKIWAVLRIEIIAMGIFVWIALMINGSIPSRLAKLSILGKFFISLFSIIISVMTMFALGGLCIVAAWYLLSFFYSWMGRYLNGRGNKDALLSVLGLFFIGDILFFTPIWFIEIAFFNRIMPISEIFSPIFTIFYMTIALKVGHNIGTLKALILLFSLLIFAIIIGLPLILLFENLKGQGGIL
ncbi:MAG: Yip1 family protein [bacterium]